MRIRNWALPGKAEAEVTVRLVSPDVTEPEVVVHALLGLLNCGALLYCSRLTIWGHSTGEQTKGWQSFDYQPCGP